MTGYPSKDKPWLKLYPSEVLTTSIDKNSLYGFIKDNNKERLDNVAIRYFDNKISYNEFFRNVEHLAGCLTKNGIAKGDIVS